LGITEHINARVFAVGAFLHGPRHTLPVDIALVVQSAIIAIFAGGSLVGSVGAFTFNAPGLEALVLCCRAIAIIKASRRRSIWPLIFGDQINLVDIGLNILATNGLELLRPVDVETTGCEEAGYGEREGAA